MKTDLRDKAIKLRREGQTYGEILKQIPVARSTLSLWLRNVRLATRQQQYLTEKKRRAMLRGAIAKKQHRIHRTREMHQKSIEDVKKLSDRERWIAGVALYWAEGTKQKNHFPSQRVVFNNSDPSMIQFFLDWLENVLLVPRSKINFELYIHQTVSPEARVKFWTELLQIPSQELKIRLKKNTIYTKRKNTAETYLGLIRITVKQSTDLNRRIAGWIQGICRYSGVV